MRLTDILAPECIKVPLAAADKESLIRELVGVLAGHGVVDDVDDAVEAVLRREQTRTTGIGNGLALPHGKCSAARGLVMAMGRPGRAVDFDSVDGRPVTLVVLLLSPREMTGPHIQALARVSRLLSRPNLRQRLQAVETAREMYEIICREDQADDVARRGRRSVPEAADADARLGPS
jgi:mannitol/fructose-specific phosphotransferase system IIA component (Ntr-type)